MIERLKREHIRLFFTVLSVLFLIILVSIYLSKRENYYREHVKHKETMFMLANAKTKKKTEISEEFIKTMLTNNGAQLKSFGQVSGGYEIKGSGLAGIKIPDLVFSLEDSGIEILKFKALDNTGSGIYDFELMLR